jgi:hypothetical protein
VAEEDLRAELKAEYNRLQDTYEDFDKRSLQIKGWVASAAVAGVSLGLKDGTAGYQIWIIIGVVMASIWFLETYWKMFQYGFRDRIRLIEGYFRKLPDVPDPFPPFQIYHAWFDSHVHDKPIYRYEEDSRPANIVLRFVRVMGHPFVALPYAPLIIASIAFHFQLSACQIIAVVCGFVAVLGGAHLVGPRRTLSPGSSV